MNKIKELSEKIDAIETKLDNVIDKEPGNELLF